MKFRHSQNGSKLCTEIFEPAAGNNPKKIIRRFVNGPGPTVERDEKDGSIADGFDIRDWYVAHLAEVRALLALEEAQPDLTDHGEGDV